MAVFGTDALRPVAIAQSPPRPSIAITKYPSLVSNIWPADFNNDGRTDLVGGRAQHAAGDLVVRLGRGDGTFGPDIVAGSQLSPVTVGDLNGDSRIDIVASRWMSFDRWDLYILGGRGDGTFLSPVFVPVNGVGGDINLTGEVRDFNADGHRDLAVLPIDGSAVHIFPGNGDLTFDAPVMLATREFPRSMIVAHLNGDTRPDIAVATQYARVVDIFLNNGGLTFGYSSIPLDRAALGITAWDMDGDGRRDLIVSAAEEFLAGTTFPNGIVNIYRGNGDGTFAAPQTFPTAAGPMTAVVGDFTGDGIVDVATGNITEEYDGPCDAFAGLWDSVSILPGLGGGRLGPAATYALGNSDQAPDATLYRQRHHALKTSPLNGDGRMDLIASPGVILLPGAPASNRPPVANAGPDQDFVSPAPGPGGNPLFGSATDPDDDWLSWEWRDEAGTLLGTHPRACVYEPYYGRQTFTLTVRDGRGGVDTDTVTYTFGWPLEEEWSSQDIGAVGAAGLSRWDGYTYGITGSGADVWGTADELHFAHTEVNGDFEFTAYVPYVENVSRWTKAGLMMRDGVAAGARHASVFATPTSEKGVAFQRRPTTGGSSVHTPGPAIAPPVWLRLRREGNVVSAFSRASDAAPWALVGRQTFSSLPAVMNVGFAVSSHADGVLAEARFQNVTLEPFSTPGTFQSNDVGAVGVPGRSSTDGGSYTVTGSGADVWGRADEFHYFSREVTGDFAFAARAVSVQDVNAWTKAGLMLRDGLAAGARHAFVLATPTTAKGVAFQRRAATGGTSVHTGGGAVEPPVWLQLVREGDVVSAYQREHEFAGWTLIDSQTFAALPATVRVGFAVSSHVDGTLATATFDEVSLHVTASQPLQSNDIGAVGAPGSSSTDGTTYTVTGAGADVWGTADELHFFAREVTGDFDLVARVASVENVNAWTKAGLMVREGLAAGARHAFLIQTPSATKGVAFQRRPTAGGTSVHTAGPPVGPPGWLWLARRGNVVSAYRGDSRTTWTSVGSQTFAALPQRLRVGFAVSSHVDGALATAIFDSVELMQY